ncbi:hypothetical protein [Gemmatimonas aurantiaca]|uniref:hypothetical protein n=1 Tax=Gemmatimonas aurantiaca TaxID=173480 RepID=UPI00301DF644
MRNLDFSSWSAILTTFISLALVTLIGVGIRLIAMQAIQQRRERENRQVNERLRILIAAYKTLGGSFTGNLLVDPTHLRDLRDAGSIETAESASSDRTRRMRDAVEGALSDVLLLGTEEQVRLAAQIVDDLVAGRHTETAALVISLRNFIRGVLDLEPAPPAVALLKQGPARPGGGAGGKGRDGGARDDSRGGAKSGGGGGKGGGMGGLGGGFGGGLGVGLGAGLSTDDHTDDTHDR